MALADFVVRSYTVLLPIAQWAFLIVIFILTPLALARRTREAGGIGLFFASYLFGLVTWLLGAFISYAAYGWVGVIIGVIFLGVGVVPMAIFAAFFSMRMSDVGVTLILMSIATLAARWGGYYAMSVASED